MHEILILSIISSKFESVKKNLQFEFSQHLDSFLWNNIPLNRYNTDVDCAVGISLYFKHLANTDNEGIEFEAHINKSPDFTCEVEVRFYQSNGTLYESSIFFVDLIAGKSVRELIFADLFKTMDNYNGKIKELVYEHYLPSQG